jgi:hypothetical protein
MTEKFAKLGKSPIPFMGPYNYCEDTSEAGIYAFIAGMLIDKLRENFLEYLNAHKKTEGDGYREGVLFVDNTWSISPEESRARVLALGRVLDSFVGTIHLSNLTSEKRQSNEAEEFLGKVKSTIENDIDEMYKVLKETGVEKT